MSVISDNIATIQAKAAELDGLITQVRAAKAAIEAAEAAIRKARPYSDPDQGGQRGLAMIALNAMAKPSIDGDRTIAEIAEKAWEGVA